MVHFNKQVFISFFSALIIDKNRNKIKEIQREKEKKTDLKIQRKLARLNCENCRYAQ